ncbi:fatty acid cis/trans isomerase [Bowmanella denitrificans]|uniref:Fatty acid cis/trans isomerase n=1 Tax=Bowmanella denitrificans TaxID=366582 RepID=A0ABP3H771_9ALTE
MVERRRLAKGLGLWLLLLMQAACSRPVEPIPERLPPPAPQPLSFSQDIKPILDKRCLTCHGCFDAPCQLKLESAQALLRGAHHQEVYNGTRREAQSPTRLGIDAQTEAQWRELGFYSVLTPDMHGQSLMQNMLALGKQHPFKANQKLPEHINLGLQRQNQCIDNSGFDQYAQTHPWEGMPLGMTALSDAEYAALSGWLNQGATIDWQDRPLTAQQQQYVASWEAYLNQSEPNRQLVARWLYEHLFLAHLYFADQSEQTQYFSLQRSLTPPGQPIVPITTAQPNGDAQQQVYYRLSLIDETLVHKRHIALRFDDATQARIDQLFFASEWQPGQLPGYTYAERANPFVTFAAIPARARYQFMLDNAEYFVRTFIRGPVCRGQIATDVIRDHFWTLFQHPQQDLFITHPDYAAKVMPLLGMPGQDDDLLDAGSNWLKYREKRNQYAQLRSQAYQQQYPDGPDLTHIWHGDGNNTNALLSIFRHHDSASVERGLIGQIPQTIWWMDYPLLERTYYELVVNFNVFGNLAHQLQTRLYFDLIRNGSEQNLLRLLPAKSRADYMQAWYQGSGLLKRKFSYAPLDDTTPTALLYQSEDPYQELAQRLLADFDDINAMRKDPLNRCTNSPCARQEQAAWMQQTDNLLAGLSTQTADNLMALRWLPDVTLLRISNGEKDTLYSLIRNRAHSNVAFMLGESLRYEEEKDNLTIFPGLLGSYPNFIFDLPAAQLGSWLKQMQAISNEAEFEKWISQWGLRRTHPLFWQTLDNIHQWHKQHRPLEAGVLDINRYKNL